MSSYFKVEFIKNATRKYQTYKGSRDLGLVGSFLEIFIAFLYIAWNCHHPPNKHTTRGKT
jgi:hypothetical protein